MLPLSLLKAAETQNILVELKNGDTYNGKLVECDNFMNINLKDIVLTSSDGESFWKLTECYIRGNTIKYLRVDPQVIDKVNEMESQPRKKTFDSHRSRGGYTNTNKSSGEHRGRGRGGNRGAGRGGKSGSGGNDNNNNNNSRRGGGGRGRGSGRGRGGAAAATQ